MSDVPLGRGEQALQNFGLSGILATYLRGLDSEGVEWGSELRELRFQAAWRSTQWDCDLPERSGTCPGLCVVSGVWDPMRNGTTCLSVCVMFTFTFRAFSRCFYPKRLTISTFVIRM